MRRNHISSRRIKARLAKKKALESAMAIFRRLSIEARARVRADFFASVDRERDQQESKEV